jgi:MFS family permease
VCGHNRKWYIARVNTARARLGRTVIALGAVSFFTDMSSEMIYPLLPVFLTSVLGANASFIGAIEGAAESTASLLKLASGWWSDRVRRRKPLVVWGYTLASVVRPLVAIAETASHVLMIRLADRIGKGIRGAPRDALIADSTDPSIRGRAFGFQRASDHAGAVLGPLIAFAVLSWTSLSMRDVFWLAAIPGALAVVTVIVAVKDAPRDTATSHQSAAPNLREPLPRRFWMFLGAVLLFTLGNSTDAFLLLRATQLGVPVALAPILWAALHVVKTIASTPGGALSDRIGRKPTLIAGWTTYALVYLGFAVADAPWHAWALFAVYGVYFGLTEGTERAMVSDVVPALRRGAAFGWFHLTIGLGALPASLLFGLLWDSYGVATAFMTGAALAVGAAVALLAVSPQQHR